MSELAELIKSKRIEKHLTMEQLGKLCGVQKSAVSKWENGRVSTMKASTAVKLCKALGIPQAKILDFVLEDREVPADEMERDIVWNSYKQLNESQKRAVFMMIQTMLGVEVEK